MASTIKSDIIRQEKLGKPVIGCFPLYPPVELFASMGLHPVVLWNLHNDGRNLTDADRHVQNYACGIARELVQFVVSEPGDHLGGIFSYNACDTLRNLPEILGIVNRERNRDIAMLRMHIPQVDRAQSDPEDYLKNEIRLLIKNAETAFNVKFSSEVFVETTKKYARLYELCREAESLVATGELSFGRFSGIVLGGYSLPVDEQIDQLERMITRAVAREDSITKKVVVSGIMPPPPKVIKAIEDAGLLVVANDIAALRRSYDYTPAETDDPVEYYSDMFKNRFPCTTLLYTGDARVTTILDLVDESGAEGVIFSGEKFCEHEYFEFPYLTDRLQKRGISTLMLEFSVDDLQNVESYITRVEAFSELAGVL